MEERLPVVVAIRPDLKEERDSRHLIPNLTGWSVVNPSDAPTAG